MKRKLFCNVLCIIMLLSLFANVSVGAYGTNAFIAYLDNYEIIQNQNVYSHNWFMGETATNHGNEGVVASKITDFDNDGDNELLVFVLHWDSALKKNVLDFTVVEQNGSYAYEQSTVRLSDDSSCFHYSVWEDMKITLKNNCVGYYYRTKIVDGLSVTYKACTYDGNKINTNVTLYDPGYTDGDAIYDVTHCNKRDYYEKGISLFEDYYDVQYGLYNSYESAVNDYMSQTGIKAYYKEEYGYVGSFENTELLCSLECDTPSLGGEAPFTTIAKFTVYANAADIINVVLNGKEIEFDQPPVIIDDRTMVPIRAILEAMGYAVDWNQNTKTATATKGIDKIVVQIGNYNIKYTTNGVSGTYYCDVAPQIISDRTLVPVRAISESAGCNVDWDGNTKTVYINK